MIRLCVFGSVGLTDGSGREMHALLAQPKRLALLIYLAAARPLGFHRRDSLLPLFWPDLDDTRARDALNQALHFLRQGLGGEVIQRRGPDELGIDPERLWCDAVAFRAALEAGRTSEALEWYRGAFLEGFFVEEGGGFEQWLETERAESRELAARGARRLAEQLEAEGSFTLAVTLGRRAVELAPDDERTLRRVLQLHARAGDRAGAVRIYEAFARRLRDEYACDPSPETVALAESIRGQASHSRPQLHDQAEPDDFSRRYRIERELGAGGMATVYLARDLKHDRDVAVKKLRPEIAGGLARERFIREIRIVSRLQHPNIVPLFDSGDADGELYFVMPLVEGETLRGRLTRGRLSINEVVHLLREIASALAYAHEQGVVHRDIKPENILLIDQRAVLADFGIAYAAQAARLTEAGGAAITQPSTLLGTPAYMAPEQAAAQSEVDHRADLYSLGAIAYEMLAGRTAMSGVTPQQIMAAQILEDPQAIQDIRPDAPAWLSRLVMACLEKEVSRRPQSAVEIASAIAARSLRHHTGRRRFGATRVVAGSVVLATGLLLAWLAVRAPPPDPGRVLVGLFEDRTGDPAFGEIGERTTAAVVAGLASSGLVQTMDAASVTTEAGRARDYPSLRPLARQIGAGSVVSGTIARRGDSLEFQLKLTDVTTGELLRPVRPVVWLATEPAGGTALVAQRVMAAYAAHLDPRFREFARVSQPGRYDAYREFHAGLAVYWGADGILDDNQITVQLDHFQRAIVLDPAFIAPRIAVARFRQHWFGCQGMDSVAAALQAEGGGLLPRDQAALDVVVAVCRRDPRGRYMAAQRVFSEVPELAENVVLISQAAWTDHRPREALQCLDRLKRTRNPAWGRGWCWNVTMHAHHQLGQYREALELVDEVRAGAPDNPLLERYQMRQWAALGLVDRVTALIEQRVAKSSQLYRAGDDMLMVGEELRGHGYLAAGRDLCERGVAWYEARPSSEQGSWGVALSQANLMYCAERWEDARKGYQRLADGDSSESGIGFRIRLGALAARRGDSAEVARIDRWLEARDNQPLASYGRAVLAGFRGDEARALALFQFAWERGMPTWTEAHADPALEPLRDYPLFLALLQQGR